MAITHSTLADASMSEAGKAAWNADHTGTWPSSDVTFAPSGIGAQTRTIQAVERAVVRGGDFDTNANFLTAAALLTEKFAVGELTVRGLAGIYVPDQSLTKFEGSIAFGNGLRNLLDTVPGTDGRLNTAVGDDAGLEITTGRYNTAVGNGALKKNTTGISNTAVGTSALNENLTANYNTAVGLDALQFNTIGTQNTSVGERANWQQTDGDFNTAIGAETLYSNLTGSSNVAVGLNALYTNLADNNIAVGVNAAFSNSSGTENCAIGRAALYNNTTGNSNVAVGNSAGRFRADGSTALGTVTSSVFVGEGARGGSADGQANVISIGVNAVGGGSNTVTLGNTDIVTTRLQGRVGIGTSTFGTNADGPMLTLFAPVAAPTTGPADSLTMYASDISAGNTMPAFFCEGTAVLATGQADSASSVRVKMRINGTEVTLLAI